MLCKNCGASLPDGSKFCVSCGAPTEQIEETAPQWQTNTYMPPPKKKSKLPIIIVSVIITVIIAVVIAAAAYTLSTPKDSQYPWGADSSEIKAWIEENRPNGDIKAEFEDITCIEIPNYDGHSGLDVQETYYYNMGSKGLVTVVIAISENSSYSLDSLYDMYTDKYKKIYGKPSSEDSDMVKWYAKDVSIVVTKLDDKDELLIGYAPPDEAQ